MLSYSRSMVNSYQAFTLRLKFAAQYGVDTLLRLTRKGKHKRHPPCVLIVRLDGIGDFVLWLDAARAIASYHRAQGKCVIIIANSQWADWAIELGIFDDVVALDRRKFDTSLWYRWRVGRQVRMMGCTIAINPTFSREWLFGDAIVRVSGASQRIGWTGDLSNITSWQRRLSNRGYSQLISADPVPATEHVRNAEFVRGLGDLGYLAKVADLRSMSALKLDDAFIAASGDPQQYYVLFPGSAWGGKRWNLMNFAQLADQIFRQTGWRGVVCGGVEDIELAKALCLQTSAPLLNWAGQTNLAQLAAILSASELLVANDTSATHIAAACGVPAVCILGGGHFGRFLPYQVERVDDRPLPRVVSFRMPCFGCGWQCIYHTRHGYPHPCIDHVTVAAVWIEVERILEPHLQGGRSTTTLHLRQYNL